jgi:hypothetical protein
VRFIEYYGCWWGDAVVQEQGGFAGGDPGCAEPALRPDRAGGGG